LVTKSKNDRAVIASIVALVIAAISIGYCFSHLIEIMGDGWEKSTRVLAYFTRIIKGGIA